jgi:hypothetical protein
MRVDVHTYFQCLDFIKHLEGRSNLPKTILNRGIRDAVRSGPRINDQVGTEKRACRSCRE